MHQTITQDDVLLYIYNELDSVKRNDVERAIATDSSLLKFFQESLLLIHQLDQIHADPDNTVISILNEESRSNSLEMY